MSGTESIFQRLKADISDTFIPSMPSLELSQAEKEIMMKPARLCGLQCKMVFPFIQTSNIHPFMAITDGCNANFDEHEAKMKSALRQYKSETEQAMMDQLSVLISSMEKDKQALFNRKLHHKCTTWFTVTPTYENNFFLHAEEFRDSIALRYGQTPPKIQGFCDANE